MSKPTGEGLTQESFDYIINEIFVIFEKSVDWDYDEIAGEIQNLLINEGIAYLIEED